MATDQKKRWLGCWSPSSAMELDRSNSEAFANLIRREVICQWVAISIGMILVFPVLWMLGDRRPVVEVIDPKIMPDPVVPGAPMTLTWKVIEHRSCEGSVQRSIVDSTGRKFTFQQDATVYHSAAEPRQLEFYRELVAPLGLTPNSVATYHAAVERWCNPLQHWIWPMREELKIQFNVGAKSAQP